MKRIIFIILAIVIFAGACSKRDKTGSRTKQYPRSSLTIACTDQFRSSGLEAVLIRDFSEAYNCSVNVITYGSSSDLVDMVTNRSDSLYFDIVMGIPGSFAFGDSLFDKFRPYNKSEAYTISREIRLDSSNPLIPYGFSNMALIYNTQQIDIPPKTFGDLQDARYISQMAICDPHNSGIGRATLLWTISLFGEEGYKMLWLSLRKNIGKTFDDPQEAYDALKNGQYAMIIGPNSIPAWFRELDNEADNFKAVIPGEGSYLYTELAGISSKTVNPDIANAFLEFLLSPKSQRMVIYKLGLLPANSKAELPMNFARIPIYSHSSNANIEAPIIVERFNDWLNFWDDLFSYRIN